MERELIVPSGPLLSPFEYVAAGVVSGCGITAVEGRWAFSRAVSRSYEGSGKTPFVAMALG